MNYRKIACALVGVSAIAFGQATKPVTPAAPAQKTHPAKDAPKPKEPPKIGEDKLHKFWKANAEMQYADEQQRVVTQNSQQKHAAYNAAVTELRGICGNDFQIQFNAEGDPGCQAEPAEVKK